MERPTLDLLAPRPKAGRWWKRTLGGIALLALILALTPWLVGPKCPNRLTIATGSDVGAYFAFGNRYRDLLAEDGIGLDVRKTAGSVENTALLKNDDSGVAVAIIQGGTAESLDANPEIQSLASLFLEPVWVFYRNPSPIHRLADLRGKRISVGEPGSGTRPVALELLRDNGLSAKGDQTRMMDWGGRRSAAALKAGTIDAAFFVLSPTAPIILELLRDPEIQLLNFDRTLAYKRRHPYLSSVTISEGMLDLENNLPTEDIELLAPTAVLVARKDLHPALVPVLLKAASRIHENGGILESPREFPSEAHVEYPLNVDAKSYLRSGPSFLYRTFPFSVAAWMDRMKLMLLPLCTLLIPLIKAAPPLYRWRIRSKIYKWYRVLRQVDLAQRESATTDIAASLIDQLRQVERELSEVSVPLSFMEEFYNLRWHVAFVLDQLEKQRFERLDATGSSAECESERQIRQIPQADPQLRKAA